MNLEKIIEIFKSYGYYVKKSTQVDLAYAMDTKWRKLDRPDRHCLVIHFTFEKPYPSGDSRSFTLFENYTVHSDGVSYDDPCHMYYFFSFDGISKVYRDDEFDLLLQEWNNRASKVFSVSDLRNIKLASVGV